MTISLDTTRLQRISHYYRRAVDNGRLPGFAVRVNLGETTVYRDHYGSRNLETQQLIEEDTIFRIFSMTKPITSVAAMCLVERGELELRAPVSEFIPEFADTPVCADDQADHHQLAQRTSELTVWHLLTHTSGLTYPFMGKPSPDPHAVNSQYRNQRIMDPIGSDDLAASCRKLAAIPLLFQPGSAWNYSVSTDVLGRVLEVAGGAGLDTLTRELVLDPLGMTDTAYTVPEPERDRVAQLYLASPGPKEFNPSAALAGVTPNLLSGGGGLYSTISDYQKFAKMLAGGGAFLDNFGLDGRVLGAQTLKYMTRNHLPGGRDIAALQRYRMEDDLAGLGFGLGFAVVVNSAARRYLTRDGVFYWNGAGGSTFFVDPETGVSATFMMSVRSADNYTWESRLHELVFQALQG